MNVIRDHLRCGVGGSRNHPILRNRMTTAFERIRIVLKLKDPDDPLIEVVAKKVISLASQGTHFECPLWVIGGHTDTSV